MPRQARLDAPGILQHVILRGIEKGLFYKMKKTEEILLTAWETWPKKPEQKSMLGP